MIRIFKNGLLLITLMQIGCGVDRTNNVSDDSVAPTINRPIEVTTVSVMAEMRSAELVLLKFGAPWCPPCRKVDIELEKIATENAGRLKVLLVNVDDEPDLAERYGIRAIPHLFLFQDGKKIDEWEGFKRANTFQQSIDGAKSNAD